MAGENDNLKIELLTVKDQSKTDRELASKLKTEALEIRNQARQELMAAEKVRTAEEQRIDEAKKKAYADAWGKWSFVTSLCDWIGNVWIAILIAVIGVMVFMGNSLNRADVIEVVFAIMKIPTIILIISFITFVGLVAYLIAERPTLGKIALFLSVTITIFSLACVEYLKTFKDINWLQCEIPILLFITAVIALLWDSEGRFRLTK